MQVAWLAAVPALQPWRSPLLADLRAARGLLACSTNRGAVRQLPVLASQLRVPSLWIAGSRDGVMQPCYVRHLAGYCRGHRVALMEGVGHLPMRERPEALLVTHTRPVLPWLRALGCDVPRDVGLVEASPPGDP